MATLEDIRSVCTEMVGPPTADDRPVVVFSALWPLARALGDRSADLAERVVDCLIEVAGPNRSLLMPVFTRGYRDGLCDLDGEPGRTGQIGEAFRRRPGVLRTASAFFSFAVHGPDAAALADRRARHEWGEGSPYEWMEQRNAHFLMLGTHPTHCSFLHRVEWLAQVPYRYDKSFSGAIRLRGDSFTHEETLMVRSLDPPVTYDLTRLSPALQAGGMCMRDIAGVPVSYMGAIAMRDAFAAILRDDPLFVVENPEDFIPPFASPKRSVAQ